MSQKNPLPENKPASNYEPWTYRFTDYVERRRQQDEAESRKREAYERQRYEQQLMQYQQVMVNQLYGQRLSSMFGSWADAQVSLPAEPKYATKVAELKNAKPRMVTARMPDSVSLLTAYRAWALGQENGQFRLKAIGKSHLWQPKKRLEAECAKGIGNSEHPAPQKTCDCGIWSFKNMDDLVKAVDNYSNVKVVGAVSLWGRIIETENGFRSQYAYPKELWLLDESLEELGYIYGVPVRTS